MPDELGQIYDLIEKAKGQLERHVDATAIEILTEAQDKITTMKANQITNEDREKLF